MKGQCHIADDLSDQANLEFFSPTTIFIQQMQCGAAMQSYTVHIDEESTRASRLQTEMYLRHSRRSF